MSYKSTRRQWVKLWVNEWLDGTTRFELTAPQRLLWVDLLALAGRSRFPGFVYAGLTNGDKKVGYPIAYLAGVLQMDEIALSNSLTLLRDHGHITLEESSPEKYVIGIVNWEKYQSEYFRQKTYRKVTTKVTTDSTSRLPVEVEGEVEVEVEVEVEGEKRRTKAEAEQPPQLQFKGSLLRITEQQHRRLSEVFGLVTNVDYNEADLWLEANPQKKRRNHFAFMRNWLSRSKEKTLPVKQQVFVGSGPEVKTSYCSRCGHTGSWHLNETKHGRAPDHQFTEQMAVSA